MESQDKMESLKPQIKISIIACIHCFTNYFCSTIFKYQTFFVHESIYENVDWWEAGTLHKTSKCMTWTNDATCNSYRASINLSFYLATAILTHTSCDWPHSVSRNLSSVLRVCCVRAVSWGWWAARPVSTMLRYTAAPVTQRLSSSETLEQWTRDEVSSVNMWDQTQTRDHVVRT